MIETRIMVQLKHYGKLHPSAFTDNEAQDAFQRLLETGRVELCDGEGNYQLTEMIK